MFHSPISYLPPSSSLTFSIFLVYYRTLFFNLGLLRLRLGKIYPLEADYTFTTRHQKLLPVCGQVVFERYIVRLTNCSIAFLQLSN